MRYVETADTEVAEAWLGPAVLAAVEGRPIPPGPASTAFSGPRK